ncbi:MAG: MATE family efflux transporter [Lachnospiraceae bacterium]|nr:MATE family efflux transporter [Lachnospiraceae bacterium]
MKSGNSKKNYEIDMCNGPVLGKMLLFAVPLMCSSVLQLLFNAADVVVVGRFAGNAALAAVGSNSALINLLTNLFIGLSVGVNVLVSRYYGAKQGKNIEEAVHTAMLLSILSGGLIMLAGCLGAEQILNWMKTPEDVLPLSSLYLRIYFLGMIPSMVYNFGSAVLRAVGDTKRPLYYLTAAGIVNVLLNLFFVIVCRLSVAGVGIATVISQTISAALILRCMMQEEGPIRLELRRLRICREKFWKILQIGLPASVQSMVFSFSNVIIQASVNSFGAVVVAGNSAASSIEGFVYVAMNAFYQASLSFTGQNVGAGKNQRINKILYTAQGCVICVGLILGNAAVYFGPQLLSIYTTSPEVVQAGMERLKIIAGTYALCGVMEVIVGSLRGMGCSVIPMISSMVGACGLRLFWIFTFFRTEQFHTLTSLYLTYPVSWIVTAAAHGICFMVIRRRFH